MLTTPKIYSVKLPGYCFNALLALMVGSYVAISIEVALGANNPKQLSAGEAAKAGAAAAGAMGDRSSDTAGAAAKAGAAAAGSMGNQSPAVGIKQRLIGTWEGYIGSSRIFMVFSPDGKVTSYQSSRGIELKYQLHTNLKPMGLDIGNGLEKDSIKTIFSLSPHSDELRIDTTNLMGGQRPNEIPRPKAFTKQTSTFRKVSDSTKISKNVMIEDGNKTSDKAKEMESKMYVSSVARAQQAYFLEEGRFAYDLNGLSNNKDSASTYYSYEIKNISKDLEMQAVMNLSRPKTENLRSYISIVIAKGGETFGKTCVSVEKGFYNPSLPTVNGQDIQCPAGYKSL
jgi:Type IV pilin-like G and H, putative